MNQQALSRDTAVWGGTIDVWSILVGNRTVSFFRMAFYISASLASPGTVHVPIKKMSVRQTKAGNLEVS